MAAFYVAALSEDEVEANKLNYLLSGISNAIDKENQRFAGLAEHGIKVQNTPVMVYCTPCGAGQPQILTERFGNHYCYVLLNEAAKKPGR
ncbi:MAG: hypothetical protein AB1510_02565 [Bacillota bacterium]